VALSVGERDVVRKAFPSLRVTPAVGSTERYDLTPSNMVGVVSAGGLTVEVAPKLPVSRLLFLLSYGLEAVRFLDDQVELKEEPDLVEAIVPLFVAALRRAFSRGLLQGYREHEEALQTIRGRIRIDDQLRRRYGLPLPIEVRFDDFTVDTEQNRLLRAAVHRLQRLHLKGPASRRALSHADGELEAVSLVEFDARRLPVVTFDRLNERYRPAVALATMILAATSVDLGDGMAPANGFVVDLSAVFESFVFVALRDELGWAPGVFRHGAGGLSLDRKGRVALEPDLSSWDGGVCTFVGDVKYKTDVPAADLYQLLAYTVAADAPAGMLVYAEGNTPTDHEVVEAGKTLQIRQLDLDVPPVEILGQVADLAEEIRTQRVIALARRGWGPER
jgi:5-methylcytosine-specific restriction enzyme subunit McrC